MSKSIFFGGGFDDFWAEAKSDNDALQKLWEILLRNFSQPWQILAVKGVDSLSESVKKEKFVMKIFFQLMLNEVLNSCKKWYLLM